MENEIQVGRYYLVTVGTFDGMIEYRGTYIALITKIEDGTVTMTDAANSGWEMLDDLLSMATNPDVVPVSKDLALAIQGACLTHYLERMLHGRISVAEELSPS